MFSAWWGNVLPAQSLPGASWISDQSTLLLIAAKNTG